MQMPAEIVRLIEHFDRNIKSFKATDYKEAQLRAEFASVEEAAKK